MIAVVAIGSCFVTLLGIFIGQRLGLWQFTLATKAHELNIRRSTPKLGTEVRIEERQLHSASYSPIYFLRVTIYNAGELAAKQLKGHCELRSDNSVKQFTIPISREFLDSTRPYELESRRLEGTTIRLAMRGEPNQIRCNVDIEFDYLGLSPDEPHHYSATYHFDHNTQAFIQD
jgi:hypothetical protein